MNKFLTKCLHAFQYSCSAIHDTIRGIFFDKLYGVDFHKMVKNKESDVPIEEGNQYQATHARALIYLKSYLKINVHGGLFSM